MSKVKVAAVQMRCAPTVEENLQHAEALVREAAANGAQIILLPELLLQPEPQPGLLLQPELPRRPYLQLPE